MSGSFDVEALLAEEEAKAIAANARRARQASGSNAREDGGRLSYTIREKPNFDRSSNDRDVRADGGRLSYPSREKRSRDRDGDEAMTSSPFDKSNAHDSAREKHDRYSGASFVVDTNPDPNYRARLHSNDLLDNKRHVLGEGRLSSVIDDYEDSHSKNKKDSYEDEGRLRNNDRYADRRSESRHSGGSRDVRSDRYRGDGYYPGGREGGRRRSRSPGDSYRPRRDDRDDRDRRSRDDRERRDDRDYRDRRDDRDRERYRDGRRDNRDRGGRRHEDRRNTSSPVRPRTPEATEDERDRRTVFVQQLAARLRSKDLIAFFEKVGPVKEAQIVKDRVSGRSKGVGYVEFKNEESVAEAIKLTGQQLLGIPIIAQLTEAEKNRQARNTESTGNNHANSGAPFHRLYVGNIHFSINETDLQNIFEPFGELEFVQLQKEETGRSRGYGFVQFRDPTQAREALEKMNGFELAKRPIRVGLGNDKFTNESTKEILQSQFNKDKQGPNFQGSSFSGAGGRGAYAGGSNGTFDRAGGRDDQKGTGAASALDDTDVGGVNFSNYSRDSLMRKLARVDEPSADKSGSFIKPTLPKAPPVQVSQPSRCVVLRNMFDPAEETGDNWIKELEDDVRVEAEDKYGHVVHIAVDPNTQGDIYLKFDRVMGGENAIKGLNGRFFGGRMITAGYVVDAVYSSLFGKTKGL